MNSIRPVTLEDAQSILDIYGPYVQQTAISFEETVPSVAEMQERIREYSKFGWFVYEIDKKVVGYAYGSKHAARAAYRWSCECSVYLQPQYHRQGIARALYTHLFDHLKNKGHVNVFAGVSLPNVASVKLHESFGFKPIGVYPKTGYKFGKWHDVGWWGKTLNEHTSPPPELKNFSGNDP